MFVVLSQVVTCLIQCDGSRFKFRVVKLKSIQMSDDFLRVRFDVEEVEDTMLGTMDGLCDLLEDVRELIHRVVIPVLRKVEQDGSTFCDVQHGADVEQIPMKAILIQGDDDQFLVQ